MAKTLRDEDLRDEVTLGLALALWECAALDRTHLGLVRTIVQSGRDLETKRRLDATPAFVRSRRRALTVFFDKLLRHRLTPRPRRPAAPTASPFRKGCCFAIRRHATTKRGPAYVAFWVADASKFKDGGQLDVACLDLEQRDVPTLAQCRDAFVRGVTRTGGTLEGSLVGLEYEQPDARFFAALEAHTIVLGAAVPKAKVNWMTSSSTLDLKNDRAVLKRLLAAADEATRSRARRTVRLGELAR